MYGYVYETTCLITGKKYIGQHHVTDDQLDPNYLGSGILLNKAIKRYGKENFECVILKWCETRQELLETEKQYISETMAPINEDYYNIADGGQGGHSEYYKQPITQKQLDCLEYGRRLPASEKLKQQLSQRRKGIQISDETRKKLSDKQKGNKCINNGEINKYISPDELAYYISIGWKLGMIKPNAKDVAKKIAISRSANENWKQNLSLSFKGRKWVTNGKTSKQVHPNEVDFYIEQGFRLGRK